MEVGNVPTCGIFCVEFPIDSWKQIDRGIGRRRFFDFPKNHPERMA